MPDTFGEVFMGLELRLRVVFYLALALPASAASVRAAGFESFDAAARGAFFEAAAAPMQRFALAIPVPSGLLGKDKFSSVILAALREQPSPSRGSQDIALDPLLNRHLKTSLKYTLGGKTVWVSGGFDRTQKAYAAILEDGASVRYFDVEQLVSHSETLDFGPTKYKLSISVNDFTDLLENEIVLTNLANKKDQQRLTLREMLAAVAAAGADARIGGDAYKVFYYDDIKDGQASAASRSFAFILTDAQGQIHVFLVPAELVPGDKIAVFRMRDNRPVGLQRLGSTLKVYDNP